MNAKILFSLLFIGVYAEEIAQSDVKDVVTDNITEQTIEAKTVQNTQEENAITESAAVKNDTEAETAIQKIETQTTTTTEAETINTDKDNKKPESEAENTIETWQQIINDICDNNGIVKAAYSQYQINSAVKLAKFSRLFMPDDLTVQMNNRKSYGAFGQYNETINKTMSVRKNLDFSTFANIAEYSSQEESAFANYETTVVRELIEVLPAILTLIQEKDLIELHEKNLQRLERGLKSVQMRASAEIGLNSPADVSNAIADYEEGKSQFIDAQENIRKAKALFVNKVGRAPKNMSTLLDQIPTDQIIIDITKTPAVKAALLSYHAARARNASAQTKRFIPGLYGSTTQSSTDEKPTIEMGISWSIYNADTTEQAFVANGQAKASLNQYKASLDNITFEQEKYETTFNSNKQQVTALTQAVQASEKYAIAETNKFQNAFNEGRVRLISPSNMLIALAKAHNNNLRLLTAKREQSENIIRFLFLTGSLWMKKANKIELHNTKATENI